MITKRFAGLVVSVIVVGMVPFSNATPLCAQSNAQRGAVSGGAAGAIIGGIIGHQNNETPEGILIGGAVGALAGGLVGKNRDQQVRQQYYYQQQQRQVAYQNGVSINDVVSLTGSGVGSQVIINQIRMHGVQQRVGVNEIIALHQQGVDNTVIDAMQRAPIAGTMSRRPVPRVYQRPAGVQPVLVPAPIHAYPPYYGHHHYYRRPAHHGSGIYFNFGH